MEEKNYFGHFLDHKIVNYEIGLRHQFCYYYYKLKLIVSCKYTVIIARNSYTGGPLAATVNLQ